MSIKTMNEQQNIVPRPWLSRVIVALPSQAWYFMTWVSLIIIESCYHRSMCDILHRESLSPFVDATSQVKSSRYPLQEIAIP